MRLLRTWLVAALAATGLAGCTDDGGPSGGGTDALDVTGTSEVACPSSHPGVACIRVTATLALSGTLEPHRVVWTAALDDGSTTDARDWTPGRTLSGTQQVTADFMAGEGQAVAALILSRADDQGNRVELLRDDVGG